MATVAADLPALVVVWEVAVPGEASRTELLAGVRVLVGLREDAKQTAATTKCKRYSSLCLNYSLTVWKMPKAPTG